MKWTKCEHCEKEGLPSIWIFIDRDGNRFSLITECANELRIVYGDGANNIIVETK
jgi:hypothetical protein